MMERLAAHRRALNLLGFAICAALLVGAYYLQYVEGMEPCPLCIFQRLGFVALAGIFLIAGLHAPAGGGAKVYAALVAVAVGIGSAIALRHLYLQSLPPDQVPACGPGLDYLMDAFPLMDVLRTVLQGSGECAEVDLVMGLSIPVWSLLGYGGLLLLGVAANWARRPDPISASS